MRKYLISAAILASTIAAAAPAAAQWAPSGNAYGYNNYGQGNRLEKQIVHTIVHHTGPIYLLNFAIHAGLHDPRVLGHFNLALDRSTCIPILSRLDSNAMHLCRLTRVD